MLKTLSKFGLLATLTTTLCVAQQSSIQKEGGSWTSTVTGSLSGARNLHIKVEVGAVRVEGGSSPGISYVIRNRSYESSEDRARRQFQEYKISSYMKGDTAWIVGEWEGGRPHKFSSDVTVSVPRDMDFVKIETELCPRNLVPYVIGSTHPVLVINGSIGASNVSTDGFSEQNDVPLA